MGEGSDGPLLAMLPRAHDTTLLIVDDEPLLIRAMTRFVPEGLDCKVAGTVAEALALITSEEPLHGLATDVYLSDGTGFDIIESWIVKYPEAPVVVFTGRYDNPALPNRACAKNSRFLAKPFGMAEFRIFTSDVLTARWGVPRAMVERFAALVRRCDLSPAQADLFAKYVNNVPRRRIAEQLGISPNTLKTRVRQLCHKMGVESLELAHDQMLKG
jgi:DNA-binding NarL/FixJ family response regulator